jgi:hypothetical protein
MPSRMSRYDVRNDGIGPYAASYCDKCSREYRSQPDVGRAIAENVVGQDPRYTYSLTPQQLEGAWKQVQQYFHECPTCKQLVCPSCFDPQSGYCTEDSPRRGEIAEAQAQQAAGVVKGLASAFGLGEAIQKASQTAKTAVANTARCPKDGTLAAPGTKFCPECGAPMIQPAANVCPKCGAAVAVGTKFCPECGAKIEQATTCPKCGADVKGAKFCPECGTKIGA